MCFLVKKINNFTSYESSHSHATNTISAWNFLMVGSGKKFSVLFSGHMACLMNFKGLLIFPFK